MRHRGVLLAAAATLAAMRSILAMSAPRALPACALPFVDLVGAVAAAFLRGSRGRLTRMLRRRSAVRGRDHARLAIRTGASGQNIGPRLTAPPSIVTTVPVV
jgi:hypothetical protein